MPCDSTVTVLLPHACTSNTIHTQIHLKRKSLYVDLMSVFTSCFTLFLEHSFVHCYCCGRRCCCCCCDRSFFIFLSLIPEFVGFNTHFKCLYYTHVLSHSSNHFLAFSKRMFMDICLEKEKKRYMSILFKNKGNIRLDRKRNGESTKTNRMSSLQNICFQYEDDCLLNSNLNARLFIEFTSVCFVTILLQ